MDDQKSSIIVTNHSSLLFLIGARREFLYILLSGGMVFLRTVERSPHWLSFEKPHCVAQMPHIAGEAMIDSLWQGHEVAFVYMDANLSEINIEVGF